MICCTCGTTSCITWTASRHWVQGCPSCRGISWACPCGPRRPQGLRVQSLCLRMRAAPGPTPRPPTRRLRSRQRLRPVPPRRCPRGPSRPWAPRHPPAARPRQRRARPRCRLRWPPLRPRPRTQRPHCPMALLPPQGRQRRLLWCRCPQQRRRSHPGRRQRRGCHPRCPRAAAATPRQEAAAPSLGWLSPGQMLARGLLAGPAALPPFPEGLRRHLLPRACRRFWPPRPPALQLSQRAAPQLRPRRRLLRCSQLKPRQRAPSRPPLALAPRLWVPRPRREPRRQLLRRWPLQAAAPLRRPPVVAVPWQQAPVNGPL
mmetsp:Transcript_135571/g.377556  ORF Transcript_135571/g.377556 Transcript_135571/m.377556 type:complete len:316 (+) Transcript_135571:551-1498(+)